jgi:Mn-dependent DtxR family transcriptional regulator/Fe2+ transport system protein FeoA
MQDVLRILCEKNKNISVEFLKNEINVDQLILSKTLKKLQKRDLITIQENSISLTEMGRKKAKIILEKHLVLENYFRKTESKIEPHTAAHIVEHYVSREVINNIKKLAILKKGGVPLTQFELSKKGLIADIIFSDYRLFERAVSMGIFPGEKIVVLSAIPSGIVLKINHKKIALDRSIAKRIKVVEYEKS